MNSSICPHCGKPFDYNSTQIECPNCKGKVFSSCIELITNFDSNALYDMGGSGVSCDFDCEIPDGEKIIIGIDIEDKEVFLYCQAKNHAGIAFESTNMAAYIGRKKVAPGKYAGGEAFFVPDSKQLYSYNAKEKAAEDKQRREAEWKANGRCSYCGGKISMFGKKCKDCGKQN